MTSNETIKVWDSIVRNFHWALVICFFISYITEDDFITLHSLAGYFVLLLIILRLLWGFIGTQHAQFKDFVYPFATIKDYLKSILAGKSLRYIGHNPAGGLMIIIMLISLLLLSITGIMLYGTENSGPLATLFNNSSEFSEDMLEEIHEFFANFTVLLITIHIGGVLIESLIHKENLIKAMFTGLKRK